MIPRYSRPEMAEIWSPQSKYRIWFEIEAHACDAMASLGIMPPELAKEIWKAKDTTFDVQRIEDIEAVTRHDVIAFLTYLSELVDEDASRYLHLGMTSSDVLDTCFNVQLSRACDILIADLERLLETLKVSAFTYRHTVCVGRSHGVHAEPTTFGLKLALAHAEMARNLERLRSARLEISVGAISGAVGTYAHVEPEVERHVCSAMGLRPETISTQVVPRDRHAAFFATLAIIASSIERMATEIRHLQRSEVREVEEGFRKGQKGSSAMPHKRNPIHTENLTGLARLVRMSIQPALENVALWHERDISHSSVERIIGPDTTIILDFALDRLDSVVRNLVVHPERMKENLDLLKGLTDSQRVMLALVEKGVARDDAYKIVQRNAMKTWDQGVDFIDLLKRDPDVAGVLSEAEIEEYFDLAFHLRHVDSIFERVFSS